MFQSTATHSDFKKTLVLQALLLCLSSLPLGLQLSGCVSECAFHSDCPDDFFCNVELEAPICQQECANSQDCSASENCSERRQCIIGLEPEIVAVTPSDVRMGQDSSASIKVDFRFRSEKAIVGIRPTQLLSADAYCVPFTPLRTEIVAANASSEERGSFRFEVPALGDGDFEAYIEANGILATRYISVSSEVPSGFGGMYLSLPLGGALLNANLMQARSFVETTANNLGIWSFTQPVRGGPSPLQYVGEGEGRFAVAFPLARGPQTFWLTVDGADSACGRSVDTEPSIHRDLLELAFFYESGDDALLADLDLEIIANLENESPRRCTANEPNDLCLFSQAPNFISSRGHESIYLALEDGLYGIAVRTGAVTSSVTGILRISLGDEHLDFIGPRKLQTADLQSWLAARIYVIGGSVTLEPIDVLTSTPPADVTTW